MVVIFLAYVVFLCVCADCYSTRYTRQTLGSSSELLLRMALCCPVLCPVNSSCCGLPGLSALCLQLKVFWCCLAPLSLHCGLETLNAVNWGNHRFTVFASHLSRITLLPFLMSSFYYFRQGR